MVYLMWKKLSARIKQDHPEDQRLFTNAIMAKPTGWFQLLVLAFLLLAWLLAAVLGRNETV